MNRIRKAKTARQQKSKSKAVPDPPTFIPNWQSVIADAEECMFELRRSIEWAKAGRDRLRAASGGSAMRYRKALHESNPDGNYTLSIWAR